MKTKHVPPVGKQHVRHDQYPIIYYFKHLRPVNVQGTKLGQYQIMEAWKQSTYALWTSNASDSGQYQMKNIGAENVRAVNKRSAMLGRYQIMGAWKQSTYHL
jgi:hypothetical protein